MSRTLRAIPRWAANYQPDPRDRPLWVRQGLSFQRGDDRGPIRHICGSVKVEVVGDSVVEKLNTFDDVSSRTFKRDTARISRRAVKQNLRDIVDEVLEEEEDVA